jgi:hypothetical protein
VQTFGRAPLAQISEWPSQAAPTANKPVNIKGSVKNLTQIGAVRRG